MRAPDVVAHGAEQGIDFERLFRAMTDKSVIMIDGGFCHYHRRRDGQITIHVILSNKRGAGRQMLQQLKQHKATGVTVLVAKCPADLQSNHWYAAQGFTLVRTEQTKTNRTLNVWSMPL